MSTYRGDLLRTGISLTEGDRQEQYGECVQNMQDIADLWSAYLRPLLRRFDPGQIELTGEDAAHMCTLMKIARTYNSGHKDDNFIDGANYQAIAGECSAAMHNEASAAPERGPTAPADSPSESSPVPPSDPSGSDRQLQPETPPPLSHFRPPFRP